MLGWMSQWLLPCERTSVQKAGAGLSRAQAVSAYSPSVFSCSWGRCGGCNWGLSVSCSPTVCVCSTLSSLALRSCVPGATWVPSSSCRDPAPCAPEGLSSLSSFLSLDASRHQCLCFIRRLSSSCLPTSPSARKFSSSLRHDLTT